MSREITLPAAAHADGGTAPPVKFVAVGTAAGRLRLCDVYDEPALYKGALALYSKSLFFREKAFSASLDGETLYDFARRGRHRLERLHRRLVSGTFTYRPGAARRYDLNGRVRTFYIYPWEEKVVDLLLYRVLTERLEERFSRASYAYRGAGFGIDACQRRIVRGLRGVLAANGRAWLFKRDVTRFFDSIDHATLIARLEEIVEPGDDLFRLLLERVRFRHGHGGEVVEASRGVPFGTPVACVLANLYLDPLDRRLGEIAGLRHFRYADDVIAFGAEADLVADAARVCDGVLAELRLESKPSHRIECVLGPEPVSDPRFAWATKIRHLGVEIRADGSTGLSRDKGRKIRNLFRYALRRRAGRLRRTTDPEKRARVAIGAIRSVIEDGVRNVAIVDYYLRHTDDERQLRLIDRWLAEEVLAVAFRNGHKRGSFRRLGFARLREMGLPSLVHRRRRLRHGDLPSSFFRWREAQRSRKRRGVWRQAPRGAFPPGREAAVAKNLVRERDGL